MESKRTSPQNPVFTCIDAGAKNGFHDLQNLHPYIKLIGFEPDMQSFISLNEQHYPKSKLLSYKAEHLALHNSNGELDFYYTANSSMNSLLEPDIKQFELIFGSAPGSKFWKEQLVEKSRGKIQAIRLDDYCKDNGIQFIDYLKLDTQGTEKQLLMGAHELLKRNAISVIKTEISILPTYKVQNTFSDIDVFLNQNNYQIIDCVFYPTQVNDQGASAVSIHSQLKEKTRHFPVGDAVYIKTPEHLNADMRYKAAIILIQMGYVGIALSMLRADNTYSESEAIEILLKWNPKKQSKVIKQVLKALCPPLIYKFIKR